MSGMVAGEGWTDGRPGVALPRGVCAAPGPPARSYHRPGEGELERLALGLAVVVLALLAGCSWARQGTEARYDAASALASTLRQPARGTAEERTYRNGRYRGASFAGVRVLPPVLDAAPNQDPEYREFLVDLATALESGTAQALASVPRLGPVNPATPVGAGTGLVCRVEALVHVTPTGQPVARDPVFRDPRPKIIVFYRLEDAATGEAVFQYTSMGLSHWEYGPWAMEDLRVRALEIAGELLDTLGKE